MSSFFPLILCFLGTKLLTENHDVGPMRSRYPTVDTTGRPLFPSGQTVGFPDVKAQALEPTVQFSSVTQLGPTLCDPMDCSTTGFPVHHQLLELVQARVHRVGDVIQPSHLVVPFSSCLQSLPASGSFPMIQASIRWPKYWSFSFSISPSNEYSGLISFRTDWFDLLEFQETPKSLLQHHSSKASILQLMNPQTYHQILSASFTVHATLSNYSSL